MRKKNISILSLEDFIKKNRISKINYSTANQKCKDLNIQMLVEFDSLKVMLNPNIIVLTSKKNSMIINNVQSVSSIENIALEISCKANLEDKKNKYIFILK